MNIKDCQSLVQIHIGFMGEQIQRAGGITFLIQNDLYRFRFGLFQQQFSQDAECGSCAVLLCILIDHAGTTVDDGLVPGTYAVLVDLLHLLCRFFLTVIRLLLQ